MISIAFHIFRAGALLLGIIGAAGCTSSNDECTAADASQQNSQTPPVTAKARDVRPDLSGCERTGIASFYAKKFTGRQKADGTRMDHNADNAASRTLPLGTTAMVTNLTIESTYTFQVYATTAVGNGPASTASAAGGRNRDGQRGGGPVDGRLPA